jgi:hypothetical protein
MERYGPMRAEARRHRSISKDEKKILNIPRLF